MATTVVKQSLEAVADSFVKDLIQKQGFEPMPIKCVGDSRRLQAPSSDDVHAFLKTLDQDTAIRFDVEDAEAPDELIHAEPTASGVDLDLDAEEQLILAKAITRTRRLYFAGIQSRTKRVLWAHDIRLGQPLTESEIIHLCFQMGDAEPAIVAESFAALRLQLVPAPKASEF